MHRVLTSCVNPVYAHTDSVACAAPSPEMLPGLGLGEWKQEDDGVITVRGLGNYSMTRRQAHRGRPA
jgi:hypothetical protein